ncbi:hypothetical protein [Modicisalibacter luteus]|uniref:hypothetical protein n=1 Tax=Modicisalibacter luteus TaxID=453962 RepID=UPI003640D181
MCRLELRLWVAQPATVLIGEKGAELWIDHVVLAAMPEIDALLGKLVGSADTTGMLIVGMALMEGFEIGGPKRVCMQRIRACESVP